MVLTPTEVMYWALAIVISMAACCVIAIMGVLTYTAIKRIKKKE